MVDTQTLKVNPQKWMTIGMTFDQRRGDEIPFIFLGTMWH